MRATLALTALSLLLAAAAGADYLEVNRKAPVRGGSNSSSDRLGDVAAGDRLALLDDGARQNGYYHVQFGERDGWIYATWVRRFRGDLPPAEPGGGVTPPAGAGAPAGKFVVACALPFQEFATKGPVDQTCPAGGTGNAGSQAQNRMKNNFCARGPATSVTFSDIETLQRETDKLNFPHGHDLPTDRSPLKGLVNISDRDIGEGSFVRLAAFVMKAHHSNVSQGETVNCMLTGKDNNDIHVVLMRQKPEPDIELDECTSVTAEITPHFRPWFWDPQYILGLDRPVRFSGSLTYDAAHRPCRAGKGSPKRVASWEIHPVYAIDVCTAKTLAACPANDEAKWTPLQDFHNLEEDHGEGAGGT